MAVDVLAIDRPQEPRGVEISQATVQWDWQAVAGATEYELRIDGVTAGRTSDTSYTSYNLWPGDHSLTVRAVDSSGDLSLPSYTAKLVVSALYDPDDPRVSNISDGPNPGVSQVSEDDPGGRAVNMPTQANAPVRDGGDGLIDPASWDMPEVYQRTGYELVFSDEFNGNALDARRWNGQLRWDGEWNGERFEYRRVNGEHQFYVNPLSNDPEHMRTVVTTHSPFEFNGSRLAIRAVRNPLKRWDADLRFGPLADMVAQQDFLSGAISTYDKFTQKYGYFEARIKIPNHLGTFPAFWLHHQLRANEGTQRTEIDIMENLGHAPWYIYNSFHYNTGVNATSYGTSHFIRPVPNGQIYTGTDYSLEYHTYAIEWRPGYIAWFIDEQKVSEVWNDNVDHEELYLILNMAMGGNWTNFPTTAGGLGRNVGDFWPNAEDLNNYQNPALEIDYVRVYQAR